MRQTLCLSGYTVRSLEKVNPHTKYLNIKPCQEDVGGLKKRDARDVLCGWGVCRARAGIMIVGASDLTGNFGSNSPLTWPAKVGRCARATDIFPARSRRNVRYLRGRCVLGWQPLLYLSSRGPLFSRISNKGSTPDPVQVTRSQSTSGSTLRAQRPLDTDAIYDCADWELTYTFNPLNT